jgi:hypothetical protein
VELTPELVRGRSFQSAVLSEIRAAVQPPRRVVIALCAKGKYAGWGRIDQVLRNFAQPPPRNWKIVNAR